MSDKIKVLFLCIHNAARSRMAEALLIKNGGDEFEVTSAGFEPTEANPLVVEALARIGLSLPRTERQPSVFELFKACRHFHYVISVCDEGAAQRCPIFPGVSKRLAWSFPDPSEFTGTHADKLAQVIQVRNDIEARIKEWIQTLHNPKSQA